MKEFEKWYRELPMREDAEDFTILTCEKYEKGWKAALEWVRDNLVIDSSANEIINQELGEE